MGQTISAFWNQSFFIPAPTFTETDLPDQIGKVHIVTGGYTGIGFELSRILYSKNVTIYLASRNPAKGQSAVSILKKEFPNSKGRLEFLKLDLADLSSIKASAQEFLNKEDRLDVLVNNAGVMYPPKGSATTQGYELQTGTNIYGPFLFTQFLYPLLRETAKAAETGTVRVSWAASIGIEAAPKGGVACGTDGLPDGTLGLELCYAQLKAANILLGISVARRWGGDGIVSNSFNPGNLKSELQRHTSIFLTPLFKFLCHPMKMGAYTELYAGWSPEITPDKNGCYVIPWGRFGDYNDAQQKAGKRKEDGGDGSAEKLWEACEKVCENFM